MPISTLEVWRKVSLSRADYIKNKDKILAKAKVNYAANREKRIYLEYYRHLRRKYWPSLTVAAAAIKYTRLLFKQNNKCAICKNNEVKVDKQRNKTTRLAVDHCHDTLKVRGLLCFQCNTKLGWFTTNQTEIMQYLKKAE